MANNALVETDLKRLLAAADGSYVNAYEKLVEQEKTKALELAPRTDKAGRKGTWAKALAKKDRKVLGPIYEKMRGYVAKARTNAAIIEQDPSVLTETEATMLMQQFLDLREIEKVVKADREAIKERVLASMTEELAEKGEDFPENVNTTVDVIDLGFKFCREGTGRKDPEINIVLLQATLGEDLFKQVTTEKVVTTYEVDLEKLMRAAADPASPVSLEAIRESLTIGGWKPPSFTARPISTT